MTILSMHEWPDGRHVHSVESPQEIRLGVGNGTHLRWVDIVTDSAEVLRGILRELDVDEQLVDYTFEPLERPKLTFSGDTLMFVAYASLNHEHYVRVSGAVRGRLIVTVRSDDSFDTHAIAHDIEPEAADRPIDANRALFSLLDAVIDTHFQAIQLLDADIDDLETALFGSDVPPKDFSKDAYLVRKRITRLRRVVLPMREIAVGLIRHRVADRTEAWFQDLEDHVLRAVEWTESMRDDLTGLVDTQLQLQDQRTNIVMKKLAAWAAIIAVPTLVTGWYGQNIPYPGFDQPVGFYTSTVLIIGPVLGMWALFRKIDWL